MRCDARGALMSEVFGPVYADAYDLLYYDKDYAAECDLIKRIFHDFGQGAIRCVLDLGCGTGNHAIPLAQRGYEVVGVDRSESMLAHARRKAANLQGNNKVIFHRGDIRNVDLKREFDAVLMMFAVLGYQHENADVLSALRTARRHLRPDGLLVFDVWYGPAVLQQRPCQRVKVIPTPEGQILRVASGELDIRHHICTVHFHVWLLEGKQLVAETEEKHPVRYFFPLELELFLECSGFDLIRLGAFPEFDREPDEATWNALGVARAV
ncbi:MAG: class I SAM-dependent methyltransferase [Candidatus Methanomethyliaceae archaeon]